MRSTICAPSGVVPCDSPGPSGSIPSSLSLVRTGTIAVSGSRKKILPRIASRLSRSDASSLRREPAWKKEVSALPFRFLAFKPRIVKAGAGHRPRLINRRLIKIDHSCFRRTESSSHQLCVTRKTRQRESGTAASQSLGGKMRLSNSLSPHDLHQSTGGCEMESRRRDG